MFKKKVEKKPRYPINWYADKFQTSLIWRNWLLLIVLLSLLSVLAMTAAAVFFVPLKTVKPFVVQIDEKTGSTDVITGQSIKKISANEALFKYFASNYVRARESYTSIQFYSQEQKSLGQSNLELVNLMSSPSVFNQYWDFVSPQNPNSPVNMYADKVNRQISFRRFRVVTGLNDDGLASIQVDADVVETGANIYNAYRLIIDMSAGFNESYANSFNEEQRRLNPLGFRVISYQAVREG